MAVRDQRVAIFAHVECPQLLATLVCEMTGTPLLDAVIVTRNTPGLLPHPFTLDEANRLVEHVKPLGIQAAVVAETDLPDMSDVNTMHHSRIVEDALEVCDLQGHCASRVAWDRIAVIAVGSVPGDSHMRFIDDGRPSVLSAAPMPSVGRLATPERPHLEFWLLCHSPAAVYRLKHDEFNYETLAADRAPSAAENFDRFVRRLVTMVPQARRTPGTYAYLQHMLAGYEFKSDEAIRQQALIGWILARNLATTTS